MTDRAIVTLDVEEFDLPLEYGIAISEDQQFEIGAQGFRHALDLMDEVGFTSTLFITARFAERFPDLIQRAARRHEIASHAYSHSSFCEDDLLKSRKILQKISQQEVIGFRRPRMVTTDMGAIASAGYLYDSSVHPTWIPGRYNALHLPRRPYRSKEGVWEIPVSVAPLIRFPLFWLSIKHLPPCVYQILCQWTLRCDGVVNWYLHPWEFSDLSSFALPPVIKRLHGKSMRARFSKYLRWLKSRAQCITFAEYLHTL